MNGKGFLRISRCFWKENGERKSAFHKTTQSAQCFEIWLTVGTIVELLCDRGFRQIFSDDFLYDNESKLVPKYFSPLAFGSCSKPFWGLVLNYYGTGSCLKIFVWIHDHKLIPHSTLLNLNEWLIFLLKECCHGFVIKSFWIFPRVNSVTPLFFAHLRGQRSHGAKETFFNMQWQLMLYAHGQQQGLLPVCFTFEVLLQWQLCLHSFPFV